MVDNLRLGTRCLTQNAKVYDKPAHDTTYKMTVRSAKTQTWLGIRQSPLSA